MKEYDVVIVGAGLAGLTAALELYRLGFEVALVEKNTFPKHKVCGEYISNEVRPYLESLGVDLSDSDSISHLSYSTLRGTTVSVKLPLGGFGISRHALDHRLWQGCLDSGIDCFVDKAEKIQYKTSEGGQLIGLVELTENPTLKTKVILAAYGKRSSLDKRLSRPFATVKSPWVALKEHYHSDVFEAGKVELHSFKGGYCGLSKTETGSVNLCFLIHQDRLKQGATREAVHQVLAENPQLNTFLGHAKPLFERPLSIAQIAFGSKSCEQDHILFIGDSAGLIHPLCGNGMAMAIHAAKECCHLVASFLQNELDRRTMEKKYKAIWQKQFKTRLLAGKYIQSLVQREHLSERLVPILQRHPAWTQQLIRLTHGEPLAI